MQNPTYINKEYLTERGVQWLKIDICNTYANASGLLDTNGQPIKTDKLNIEYQLAWVDQNYSNLIAFMPNAEEPTRYRMAVIALAEHNAGKKVAHEMYVDASNQGLQLYSILTRCKDTAMLCNLATGTVRQDAYTMIADELNIYFNTSKFNRKNCKKALMTTLYGSGRAGTMIMAEMYDVSKDDDTAIDEALKQFAVEMKVPYDKNLVKDAFDNVMRKIAPLAMQAMDSIQSMNKLGREVYRWNTPDGANCESWTKADVKLSREIEIAGVKQTIEIVMKKQYLATTDSKALAPNIVHSVDAYIAGQVVDRLDSWCSITHDAFATHVNDIDRLITIYKDVLVEILKSDLLNRIMTQVMDGAGPIPIIDYPNTLKECDIRASLYGLY